MIDRFDILNIEADRSENPLQLFWPRSSSATQLYVFSHLSEWAHFIDDLSLNRQVPQTIDSKYERARCLYFLAWINPDVIKAGELAALAALELALRDVYFSAYKELNPKKRINSFFRPGLEYMVEHDSLKDEKLPISIKRLVSIRNSLAHGDPFDALPYAGLLEIVRDLIGYMYRNPEKSP